MLQAIHILSGVAAGVAAVLFVAMGVAAWALINPSLQGDDRATASLFPVSSRESDYVGRGWLYRKVQWACLGLFPLCMFVWGLTGQRT